VAVRVLSNRGLPADQRAARVLGQQGGGEGISGCRVCDLEYDLCAVFVDGAHGQRGWEERVEV
jgi:hypothetical protein